MYTTLVYLFLFVCFLWFLVKKAIPSRKDQLLSKIHTPPAWPILGTKINLTLKNEDLFLQFLRLHDLSKPLTRIKILGRPHLIMFYKAEMIEGLLSSKQHIDKGSDYKFLHPWLGTGLLTSTGDKWFQRRKMLTSSFHFRILENFMSVFNEQSHVMVNNMRKELGGNGFNLVSYITLCTLDIICETAMGKSLNAQSNSESDYVKAVYDATSIITRRRIQPWLQMNWVFNLSQLGRRFKKCLQILHGFTNKVIQERKMDRKTEGRQDETNNADDVTSGKRRPKAFLDLLLTVAEEDGSLTDEDIREEVDTFMFEGHDTTSMGMSWCLFLLGCNPEHQAKIHEELDDIFGDSDRAATSADLTQMKYLEMCIKEALRLYPPVPFVARHLKEELQVKGYTIPADVMVIVEPYILHRDIEVFPDPETFNPDHFLPAHAQKRHPFAYVPFSAGPRNCIGQKFAMMEEKIVLSTFFRNYRIISVDRPEKIVLLSDLILRPKDGLKVKIEDRKK